MTVYLPGDDPKDQPMPEPAPEITELALSTGRTVRLGQVYRDARTTNTRQLRVYQIDPPYRDDLPDTAREIHLAVFATDGEPLKKPRATAMKAARLTGPDFVLESEPPA